MKWTVNKGEDALYEGTVLFSTLANVPVSPYNLSGAVLIWHLGSVIDTPIYTRSSASGTNWSFGTSVGTYTFSLSHLDTGSLSVGSYVFDIWLQTAGGNRYCITNKLGTFEVNPVSGTL